LWVWVKLSGYGGLGMLRQFDSFGIFAIADKVSGHRCWRVIHAIFVPLESRLKLRQTG